MRVVVTSKEILKDKFILDRDFLYSEEIKSTSQAIEYFRSFFFFYVNKKAAKQASNVRLLNSYYQQKTGSKYVNHNSCNCFCYNWVVNTCVLFLFYLVPTCRNGIDWEIWCSAFKPFYVRIRSGYYESTKWKA